MRNLSAGNRLAAEQGVADDFRRFYTHICPFCGQGGMPPPPLRATPPNPRLGGDSSRPQEVGMKIRDILRHKGANVVTASTSETVLEAARALVDHNIGGVVVVEGGGVIGILTERDILRLAARSPDELQTLEVGQVMTRDVIQLAPDDDLAHVMEVMTENRIRHLPVVEDGGLAGIVTIGDVVNAFRSIAEDENAQLRQYIQAGN